MRCRKSWFTSRAQDGEQKYVTGYLPTARTCQNGDIAGLAYDLPFVK